MENQPTPPWANELTEDEFISYAATYKVGEYFHLYHKEIFEVPSIGNLRYYYYDPTEHGYPKDKKYPLLVFLHGTSNALEGDILSITAAGNCLLLRSIRSSLAVLMC